MSGTSEGPVIYLDGGAVAISYPAKVVLDLGVLLVVLFDPDSFIPKVGQFRNLVAIRRTGELLWEGQLPTTTTGDCFLTVEHVDKDRLRARTFSSFVVDLDALTGRIEGNEFVK